MDNSDVWTVRCQDPNDGSGDLIVNLPNELLSQLGLGVGDRLLIDVVNGAIKLRPVAGSSPRQASDAQEARTDASRFYRSSLKSLLHIPPDATEQQIHDLVEAGFTANTVQALADFGLLNVDLQHKLSSGERSTLSESDYIFRIAHITSLAEFLFGDIEKAKRWLSKPKAHFSGKTPFEMLSTTPGTRRVEELLTQGTEGMAL
jgi:putative toxin-antitoxin system antitoxin component (TIGR02293 family)